MSSENQPEGQPAANPGSNEETKMFSPPPTTESAPLDGVTVAKYEIVRRIGEGGMGMVFLARDTQMDRLVAMKVLPPDRAGMAEFVQRFLREAQAARQLDHPNIVKVFDVGCEDQIHYFVMEYVEGQSLGALLREQRWIEENEALRLIRQAAEGLAHAHSQKVIHRDVKPDNLMLTKEGVVKVTDLGLARWKANENEASLTSTGVSMGTPYYVSPEQVKSAKHLDGRADIYSLGATLYHLLAGRPPFKDGTAGEIMAHHITEPVPPIQQFNPTISIYSTQLVNRLLAKEPSDRLQTMGEVVEAIDRILDGTAVVEPPKQAPSPLYQILGMVVVLSILSVTGWILYQKLAPRFLTRPPAEPVPTADSPPAPAQPAPAVPAASAKAPVPAPAPAPPMTFAEAVKRGESTVVRTLLDQGADANGAGADGQTVLMTAISGGHLGVVKALLAAKADPQAKTPQGETALSLAVKANNSEILKVLLENGVKPGTRLVNGFTPLHLAAQRDFVACARVLLEKGADPNEKSTEKNTEGETPLMIATAREMAELLLANGADVQERDSAGYHGLAVAAGRGHTAVVDAILQRGFAVDETASNGITALMVAALNNAVPAMEALLQRGADPNREAAGGQSVLLVAALNGRGKNAAAVKVLLQKGANPSADSPGLTPLNGAAWEGFADVVKTLQQGGVTMNLFGAAAVGDTDALDGLLKRDADPNEKFFHGRTPLMAAARHGQRQAVELLLTRGADPRCADKDGKTALDYAKEGKHPAVVELLDK